jgi:hypothetical protein
MDHLGPIVVNEDGTMARISNWDTCVARTLAAADQP